MQAILWGGSNRRFCQLINNSKRKENKVEQLKRDKEIRDIIKEVEF